MTSGFCPIHFTVTFAGHRILYSSLYRRSLYCGSTVKSLVTFQEPRNGPNIIPPEAILYSLMMRMRYFAKKIVFPVTCFSKLG